MTFWIWGCTRISVSLVQSIFFIIFIQQFYSSQQQKQSEALHSQQRNHYLNQLLCIKKSSPSHKPVQQIILSVRSSIAQTVECCLTCRGNVTVRVSQRKQENEQESMEWEEGEDEIFIWQLSWSTLLFDSFSPHLQMGWRRSTSNPSGEYLSSCRDPPPFSFSTSMSPPSPPTFSEVSEHHLPRKC